MANYLVDSNLFIQAHRVNYPLDVVKGFWEKISELAYNDIICSLDKVKNEIYENDDELKSWCKSNLPKDFFRNSEVAISTYKEVISWAVYQKEHYKKSAIDEFLDSGLADAWLVAYAVENQLEIITQEISQPNRKNKVKIPEVCDYFSVPYKNMIELFRELDIQF